MATLIETAYYTRKFIRFGAIGLVVLIVGRIALTGAVSLWKRLFPAPPPPPTVGFGKLPKLQFPQQDRPSWEYKLETVDGSVPVLGDRANVYAMPVPRPNLLALDKATELAQSLGFIEPPEKITERMYRFSRFLPLPARLDVDIITGQFDLRVDWFVRPDFLAQKVLPDEAQVIDEARNFLRNGHLLADDLASGDIRVFPLKGFRGDYKPAVSISEADFIEVDLFRGPAVENFPTITASNNQGVVRVIFSGMRSQNERVVSVSYDYLAVNNESFHSYPLKTTESAWQELQGGGGYVVSLPLRGGSITVREVGLGYYDSILPQAYFQPVYVFRGDDDFVAIVPAIDPVWVEE